MEQTIFVPLDATIYVIGAPCSGKTTLSRRIEKEATAEVKLVSADELFESRFGVSATKYAMLSPVLQQQYSASNANAEDLYSQDVKYAVAMGLIDSGLFVFDAAPNDLQEVISWVRTAAFTRIGRPIIVLKMEPSDEIYRDFCKQRERVGECLPESTLKRNALICKMALSYDYSQLFRNVVQYNISDPRAVKLEFMSPIGA